MTPETALTLWWTLGVVILSGDVTVYAIALRRKGREIDLPRPAIIAAVVVGAFAWPWLRVK